MEIIPIIINVVLIGFIFLLCVTIISFINKKIKFSKYSSVNPNERRSDIINSKVPLNELRLEEKHYAQIQPHQIFSTENLYYITRSSESNKKSSKNHLRKTLGKTGKFEIVNESYPPEESNAVNW